MQILIIED